MNEKDIAKVYATLLCSPGMNELVKLDVKLSKKAILLLSQILKEGYADRIDPDGLQKSGILGDHASLEELNRFVQNSLEKGALVEFFESFKTLNSN